MGRTIMRARATALGSAILAGALSIPTAASAQGFFDFLFGQQNHQRSVVAYGPDPGFDVPRQPAPKPRKRVKLSPAIETAVAAKPVKMPPPPVGAGPLGPFVNDPTLRAGDVVVTERGLMVYKGNGGKTHSARDFVGLAKGKGMVPGNHATLASIEKANRLAAAPTATPAVSAAAEAVKQASAETPRRRRR